MRHSVDVMRNTFWGVLILPLAAVILSGCGHPRTVYYSNPNAYLVKQLATRRIVMLGDFDHEAPLPFETLTSLLNEWVRQVEGGTSEDTSIVLVLEADKVTVNNLNNFIASGNWQPLVKYWLPLNTMEWLEFCADLRGLKLRIDSLDNTPTVKHKLEFNIIGGESSNVLDDPSFLRLSKEQGVKYFVDVRDSLSALNISAYLDRRPNTKAIIFYGATHLIGNYVHKNVAGSLPRSETGGYYLAHYLKERFGADSVLTVCQIPPQWLNESLPFFHKALSSDIFFLSSDVAANDVRLPGLRPQDFDGYITRHELDIPGHPLAYVFSKEVIRADINRLSFLEGYLPGAFAKRLYDESMESLRLIAGENFKSLNKWKSWFREAKYNGFERIGSAGFADEMYKELYENPHDEKVRQELYDIGLEMSVRNPDKTWPRTYWTDTLWPQAVNRIKLNDSIGLLWVGTTAERKQAEDYLLKRFGKPLLKPQAYLKLRRYRYYSAKY